MTARIPHCEPDSFVAGDTVLWSRTLCDYSPADGWVLKYALRGSGVVDVTATANPANTGWDITIPSASTGGLNAGTYQMIGWVELAGEVHTIYGQDSVTVTPNLFTAGAGDLQSSEEKELALINDRIQEALATDIESYSIAQRSVQKRKLEDLYKTRTIIQTRIGRQQGRRNPRREVVFRAAR